MIILVIRCDGRCSILYIVELASNFQKINGCKENVGCFTPGRQWYYSNTNYIIAGLIIEKLTGLTFDEAIQENIIKVLQRDNISIYYYMQYPDRILSKMIHGYMESKSNEGNPWVLFGDDVTKIPLYWAVSAGALTGTTGALTQSIHALFNDYFIQSKALTNQGLIENTTGQPVTDIIKQCTKACYGLGVTVNYDPNIGGEIWAYEGGTFGFFTYYYWIPKENVIIAISQNSSSDETNFDPTMNKINQYVVSYIKEEH